MGLLLIEFADSIREGDGERIICCWRVFFPIFKATNQTNYSIDAFILVAQHDFIFTPRMKQQLVWEPTVNVHGRLGKNIPCDLYMEHLNRECKGTIGSLGPNASSVNAVARIGKIVGELMKITTQYDSISELNPESGSAQQHQTSWKSNHSATWRIKRFPVAVWKKTQSLSQLFSKLNKAIGPQKTTSLNECSAPWTVRLAVSNHPFAV